MKKQTSDTGIVFDIDHFAVHDGPGIRTTVYLKGCPLRCKWCHSPESQVLRPQVLYAANRCKYCGLCVKECAYGCQLLSPEGERKFLLEKCIGCEACVKTCPTGAMFTSGKRMNVEEVVKEVLSDKVFFDNSGGGVTLSGGEVLLQAQFAGGILRSLREEGVHMIVETAGYGNKEELLMLAESVNIFYYDFKLADKEQFFRYTGGNLDIVLDNLRSLREKTDAIVLRVPLIPGITDTKVNILAAYQLARKLNIRELHLLPYNAAAGAKYEWIGRKYELEGLYTDNNHNEYLASLAPKEIKVSIMN